MMPRAEARTIVWAPIWNTRRQDLGLEHLLLHQRSADSAILAFDESGQPFRMTYRLTWDERWRVREAQLAVATDGGDRALHLRADGEGHWQDSAGAGLPALDGCIDIDIWPTPFTNTFPIRRRPMALGERCEFVMAWVFAPDLTVRPMRQGYTRLADQLYLYENLDGSEFRAELAVDEEGVVLDYQGVFRRIE
jgi:hypothetical protein